MYPLDGSYATPDGYDPTVMVAITVVPLITETVSEKELVT